MTCYHFPLINTQITNYEKFTNVPQQCSLTPSVLSNDLRNCATSQMYPLKTAAPMLPFVTVDNHQAAVLQ